MSNYEHPLISSREIANELGKRHADVMKQIRNIMLKNYSTTYKISTYVDRKGETRSEYLMTKQDLVTLLQYQRCYNTNGVKNLICKYKLDTKCIVIGSRFETAFNKSLGEMCEVFGYNYETQYNVLDKYRIDFYFPEQRLAVEYDEEHHKHQELEDYKREQEIKQELKCDFIRLDYRETDIKNASIIIKELINRG